MLRFLVLLASIGATAARVSLEEGSLLVKQQGSKRPSELLPPPAGVKLESVEFPQPVSYLDAASLPANFT